MKRIVPFLGMYLFGVATSAGVVVLRERGVADLAASAGASVPSLAERVAASRQEPIPDGVAREAPSGAPVRVPISPVVLTLAGAAPGETATPDGPEAEGTAAAPDSGSVMAFSPEELASNREVARASRRERSVGAVRRSAGPALEPSQIRGVLASHMPALRRCYERASRRQGFGAEERIQLELQITRGSVQSANVSGASSSALQQCVSSAARTWQFPEGSAQVSLPVRLRPREG